jgi:hypothetical protein
MIEENRSRKIEITMADNGQVLSIRVPIKAYRRGGRKVVMMPEDLSVSDPGKDPVLVIALLKAHQFKKKLDSGVVRSVTKLAEKEGLSKSYVAKTIKLAFLAPEIQQSILNGEQPKSLALVDLETAIPDDWREQWRVFGFASELGKLS